MKFIEKYKVVANLLTVNVQYSPSIRYGQVLKLENKEGRVITGHVIRSETYSEGEEYTNTITVREIK